MEVKDFTKEEQDKIMMKYAQLAFANLKKNIIQDLINSRNESIIYRRYSKEQIVKMLDNPQKNEKEIRELSGFIYLVSSHYRRLVDYYSTILLYNYTVIPTKIPLEKPKKTEYKKNFYHVVNQCDKYNLKHEATKALKIAVRDGVYFGLCYESEDSFYIKPFDNRYAKISSIEDGVFRFSIDMAYFSGREYLLDMYGEEIKKAYRLWKGDKENGIKGDKNKKWHETENGICLKVDESDPVYSLPLFTGVLLSVLDIEDYKMLQKAKAENDNYKVLSAKMETDDDGVPKMDFEIAQKYYGQMSQNLPEGIGLLLSPFDVDDFSFQSSSSADRNAVTDAESQFWEAAGVSSLLFGSTKATSSASLVLSVKPDEALAFSILQQFERFFNRKIKKMNLANEFKLVFSQQSIFNTDEYINRLSKACQYGVPVKLQYASSLGMSPSDIIGTSYLEDEILGLADKVWTKPLISSNTQSSLDNQGGRPTNESQGRGLTESGEQTKESDANASR